MKLQEKKIRSEITILRNHFEFMPGISMMESIFCMRQIGFMPRILIMQPIFCTRQIV